MLHLQRTAGNRAVTRLIGRQGGARPVQREILDQDAKLDAAAKYTGGMNKRQRSLVSNVVKALRRAEAAELKSPAAAVGALTTLQQAVNRAIGEVKKIPNKKGWTFKDILALDGVTSFLTTLEKEIPPAIADWDFVLDASQKLRDPFVVNNIDNLLSIKNDLRVRFRDTRYAPAKWNNINRCMVDLNEAAGKHMELWKQEKAGKGKDSQDRYMYGDPVTGDIDPATLLKLKAFEADFDAMKHIVDDRATMIALLVPLADEIDQELKGGTPPTGKQIYDKLLELLTRYETMLGFQPVSVIPLGILPGETFVRLIGEGHVLDDYGAGIVHGEATHRLQWHALARVMTKNFTSPRKKTEGWNHTPFELYQRMNQPPFSNYRSGAGASKWGSILDRGVTSTDTSYGLPGTMNRDMLESAGGEQGLHNLAGRFMKQPEVNKAWPSRSGSGSSAPPSTLPLVSTIGKGLMYQLEERFKAAQQVQQEYDWTGVHPQKAIGQFKQTLLSGGYTEREGYLSK